MNNATLKTADKILNSAEQLFADYNYDQVSIRDITSLAGVKLALVHYHFGSKEDLYRAIIKRRIGKLSEDRLYLLEHFRQLHGEKAIPLSEIVESFLAPYLYNSLYGEQGWRNYAVIVARLLSSGSDLSLSILQQEFDPSAVIFLAEMRRSRPLATEQQIQWGFDFLVGSMCNIFAEVDRIKSLSNNLCSVDMLEESCQYLFNYITSGLEGVLSNELHHFRPVFELLKTRCNVHN